MRKVGAIVVVAVTLEFAIPQPARAQMAVYDGANFAENVYNAAIDLKDEITETYSYITQQLQWVTQTQQWIMQQLQYANQIINTISLPFQIFAAVEGDINQVRNIIRGADLLLGNSGSIIQRLQAASGYARAVAYLPSEISAQFNMWANTLGKASNVLGLSNSAQQTMQTQYASLQARMQNLSTGVLGAVQAQQANIDVGHMVATQVNQVQATMVAIAQQQATKDDIAAERQAVGDMASVVFFLPANTLPSAGALGF
jgi:P-type conjugative transfer protein TrbJ